MRLLKLHSKVQNMLVKGDISAGHARALLGIEDQAGQLELAQKIVSDSLSVRQTEDLVKAYNNPTTRTQPKTQLDPAYKDLENRMREALGTRVKIKRQSEGKGKVEISYYSEDQLDEIFKVINKGSL